MLLYLKSDASYRAALISPLPARSLRAGLKLYSIPAPCLRYSEISETGVKGEGKGIEKHLGFTAATPRNLLKKKQKEKNVFNNVCNTEINKEKDERKSQTPAKEGKEGKRVEIENYFDYR